MPPPLKELLSSAETLIAKAKGAVAVAAKDIQKEVLYLSSKLDIASSADNRELVYAAVEKRIGELGNKLNALFVYADSNAVLKANQQAAKATGVQIKISKHHANAIIDAVQKAGGENIAATMTANMQNHVITALRNSVVSAMREQALTGGSMKSLQQAIKAKWEVAAQTSEGLAFVDKGGRVWNTDTYLNMNVRTNAMRIYNDALVNQIGKATGSDLVMVSRGGDPNCKHCFPWEGRILSITGNTKGFPTYDEARAAGCFHPNCVHTLEPVDEELDADEIALQRQFTPPKDLSDREAMDNQRYEIDIARKMQNEGLEATAAKIAVDRDNLADSMRQGLILADAENIVAGLTDEQVNALCPNGNPPEFLSAKYSDGVETWNKGKAGGVLYVKPKTITTEKLVKVSGVGAGKQVEPVEPPKLNNIFVGNSFAKQKAVAAVEDAFNAADAAYNKMTHDLKAFDEATETAHLMWVEAGLGERWKETEYPYFELQRQLIKDNRKKMLDSTNELAGWNKTLEGLPEVPKDKAEQEKADATAMDIADKAQAYITNAKKVADGQVADFTKEIKASENRLGKAVASKLQYIKAEVADIGKRVEAARQLRIKWHNEIEELAKEANIGRKWHPPVVAFRNTNRLFESWVRDLNKFSTATNTAIDGGKYLDASKAHKELINSWRNGGGAVGNDFDGEMATFECVYNQAKEYLQQMIASGAQPKREVVGPRSETPPQAKLTAYKFPAMLTQAQVDELLANGQSLGGTTGAKMVELDGQRYMMKLGSNTSDEHLQNEMDANAAYRAAGCAVPDFKVYEVGGQKVALTQFIDGGKPLGDWWSNANEDERAEMQAKLSRHFALDALFANHDVLGAGGDNVLVDADGNPWRIDNGSAFGFRAQGGKKKAELFAKREWIDDLWTMRGIKPNGKPSGISVPFEAPFSGMTTGDICRAAKGIDFDKVMAAVPADTRKLLEKPLAQLRTMVAQTNDNDRGGYADAHTSAVVDMSYCLRKTGFVEEMQGMLAAKGTKGRIDELEKVPEMFRSSAEAQHDDEWDGSKHSKTILTAIKSIHHHCTDKKDYKVNMGAVKAALDLKDELQKLSKTDKGAKTLLGYIDQIETAAASKWNGELPTKKMEMVTLNEPAKPKEKKVSGKNLTQLVMDFVNRGGDPEGTEDKSRWGFVREAQSDQGGNSWSGDAGKMKILNYAARGLDWNPETAKLENGYIGRGGSVFGTGRVSSAYKRCAKEYANDPKLMEHDMVAFRAMKAALQTMYGNLDIEGKTPEGDFIVCRTETSQEFFPKGFKAGGWGHLHSGGGESTSQFKQTFSGAMTIRRLPLSRMNGSYLLSSDGKGGTAFLGDGENEVTFDINGYDIDVLWAPELDRNGKPTGDDESSSGTDLKRYRNYFLEMERKRKGGK